MHNSISVNDPSNNNSILQSTQIITSPPTPTETQVPVDDTHGILPTPSPTVETPHPLSSLIISQIELKKAAALDQGDSKTIQKCEEMLSILENGGDITIRSSELRELFEFYAGNATESAKSGLEFLESILPPELAELGRVQDFFEITKDIAVLGAALIEVTNIGAGIAVLYYKQKLLDASGKSLNAAKDEINRLKQANQLTDPEFEKAKRAINEWSAALNAETELFQGEFNLFIGQAIASGVGSLAELSAAGIAGLHAGSKFVPGLEAVGASALAVHAYFEMKEKIEDDQTFSAWQAEFTQWQKQAIAQFQGGTIDLTEEAAQHPEITNTGVVATEDLLAKRKNVTQEKATALLPKFEQKREQIYEALKSYYKESLEEALNPDADTLKILIKLKLIPEDTQELSIDIENEYKVAVQDLLQNTGEFDRQYHFWFGQLETSNKEDLLKLYIDKHQTIEQTVKHSLREVVDHKLKIENEFIKLSVMDAKATFGVATGCAVISIGLFIIGLATLPLGGVGAILMLIAAAPVALSLGFWVAELVLSFRKKPATTLALYKGLSFQLITNRLLKGLAVSRMNSKAEKIKTTAAIIESLSQVWTQNLIARDNRAAAKSKEKLEEAVANHQKAIADYEVSQIKAAKWTERVDELEQKLGRLGWQDFAKNASLQIGKARKEMDAPQTPFIGPIHPTQARLEGFDSLTALNEALQKSDFDLLSEETLYIMESQLGISKTELQTMINEGGNSLELLLQKFSVLKQDEILRFITRQTARMKLDLIPNPIGGIVPNTATPSPLLTP